MNFQKSNGDNNNEGVPAVFDGVGKILFTGH